MSETTATEASTETPKKTKTPKKKRELAPRRQAEKAAREKKPAAKRKPAASKKKADSTRVASALYSPEDIEKFVAQYARRYAVDGKDLSTSDAKHAIMTVAVNRLKALWRYQDAQK